MTAKMPYKILCVCLGNICRSPTAEIVLRHFASSSPLNLHIDSAGTSNYHPNKAPDIRSQRHAKTRGYDLSSLRARQLTEHDFLNFDLILAMDLDNLRNIETLLAVAIRNHGQHSIRAQVALMSEHDLNYPKHALPDPYYGDEDGFERVLDQCESSSQAWIKHLQQQFNLDTTTP